MPIYTGTGDDGQTGLFGNRRVPKDDARIEAYGTVDELNAVFGLLLAELADDAAQNRAAQNQATQHRATPNRAQVTAIQNALFEIGADLATEGGAACVPHVTRAIAELERWIDASEAQLPQLRSFVLPAGTRTAALLHLARTVTRRAERRYWTLRRLTRDSQPVPPEIGVYLNRLSDLCFSWARLANHAVGVADVPWTRGAGNPHA